MSRQGVGYVVQELDTNMFLCEGEGDVDFTPFLHDADPFDSVEVAVETALMVVGSNFKVTAVVIKVAH